MYKIEIEYRFFWNEENAQGVWLPQQTNLPRIVKKTTKQEESHVKPKSLLKKDKTAT